MKRTYSISVLVALAVVICFPQSAHSADTAAEAEQFFQQHCVDCHRGAEAKGQLDLTSLAFDLTNPKTNAIWIRIHDRVQAGEMPPPDNAVVPAAESASFLKSLARELTAVDDQRAAAEGRATRRRMNRYEYENTLRDLLSAPWLQIKPMLPEDGEAYRFNKVGDALDVSHVQIARYMAAADSALHQVFDASSQVRAARPRPTEDRDKARRYYARDSKGFNRKIKYSVFNRSPERATFPILGFAADLAALEEDGPVTVGEADPDKRELEAMGVVASSYEPIEIKFDQFKAKVSGKYKLRFNAYSFWAGPESAEKWWRPSRTELSKGRTQEPVSVYSEAPPRQLRKLGTFEVTPEPNAIEMEVYLLAGETVRTDAVRLFRSRPPGPWRNPLAEKDGQPGVAFRWLEVSGPIDNDDTAAGYRLLFDELPVSFVSGKASVQCDKPEVEAQRLLQRFMSSVYRRPVEPSDEHRFMRVIQKSTQTGAEFHEAMMAGYSAVLCSPYFVTMSEQAGQLDEYALAARLSYFLVNSQPDAELRQLAASGQLRDPQVIRDQVDRLLADEHAKRFVDAYLDYWLDLRKADATSPDADLYPDYYLDDFLVESAVDETRAFFHELVAKNLPSRDLIDSPYVMVNERLAKHYGIDNVTGVAIRRVELPSNHVRGGLLTQASILKITANGTTTSPVLRGVWINERILGKPVPPPPAAVPAVEPDTRGATTIREQLDKHRTQESCNACHARIDPPGFALESFDILGGFRETYRINNAEPIPDKQRMNAAGYGKNGQPFNFAVGPKVDSSGELSAEQKFAEIRELKQLILKDERQVARNLVRQLLVYATGAPVKFGDRPELEAILDQTAANGYRVRDLIHAIVESELFQTK